MRHSTRVVQQSDILKGAKRFLNILSKHKKFPWGQKVRIESSFFLTKTISDAQGLVDGTLSCCNHMVSNLHVRELTL